MFINRLSIQFNLYNFSQQLNFNYILKKNVIISLFRTGFQILCRIYQKSYCFKDFTMSILSHIPENACKLLNCIQCCFSSFVFTLIIHSHLIEPANSLAKRIHLYICFTYTCLFSHGRIVKPRWQTYFVH